MLAPESRPADVLVSCRGVVKTFGHGHAAVRALRGVDLQIFSGELLLLVGPSGCGKTTLLSIIGSMLDRDGGECSVMGRDPGGLPPEERARFRASALGFVFQGFHLLPALTARENVAVPLLIAGTPRRAAMARAEALLETVGLDERPDALPGQLSGGQQQRVAIARALAREPTLVVCDEPTSSLDHETGVAMIDLLRRAGRREGRAVLVATHDNRIFSYADRIARMEDGRVVAVEASGGEPPVAA